MCGVWEGGGPTWDPISGWFFLALVVWRKRVGSQDENLPVPSPGTEIVDRTGAGRQQAVKRTCIAEMKAGWGLGIFFIPRVAASTLTRTYAIALIYV